MTICSMMTETQDHAKKTGGALLHVAWPRACALRGRQPDLIDKSGCFRR